MLKKLILKYAINQLTRVLNIETTKALKEDRDNDYVRLITCRYVLDELYARMCGYTEVIE